MHDAARTGAVGLCDMNNETIPDAETVLPKNLCPLIKGTYGFALSPIAISDRYLQINCSAMSPNDGRIEHMMDMVGNTRSTAWPRWCCRRATPST